MKILVIDDSRIHQDAAREQLKDHDFLHRMICKTYDEREQIRNELEPVIIAEKAKAKKSAEHLTKYLA